MKISDLRRALVMALLGVGGFTGALAAQTRIDVGPLFGYYRPLGRFAPAAVYFTSLPATPSDLAGLAWGGTVRVAFPSRFAAELQLSVAKSEIAGMFTPGGWRGPTGAEVAVVSVQVQYDVAPVTEAYRTWIGLGPAVIRHGGDAYTPLGSPLTLGAALGASVDAPIIPTIRMAAGITMLAYAFDVAMPADLRANPGSLQHGRQLDATVYLGVRWSRP